MSKQTNNYQSELTGNKVVPQPLELKTACSNIIGEISSDVHGVSYIRPNGVVITKDSVVRLLQRISKYDMPAKMETYHKSCTNGYIATWISNESHTSVKSIEKAEFTISANAGNGVQNKIVITDYEVSFQDVAKQVVLRYYNISNLVYLKIDNKRIEVVREAIPIGLDEALIKQGALTKACR